MSTLNVSNITDGTDTVETGYVVNGSAKAWVYASSAAVLYNSMNVSTGTDHGTGDYSYNLSSAFTSLFYAQTTTQATTAADITANRNTGRNASNIIATEIGDPHTQAKVNSAHAIVAHGDLA